MRRQLLASIESSTTPIPLTVDIDRSAVPLIIGNPATNWRLIGQGGTAPYAYAIVTGSLPAGLTLNASGSITGTPSSVGQNNIVVQVQDSASQTFVRSFSIVVSSNLVYSPRRIPVGEVGVPYSYTFSVRGATGSVTWAMINGSLSPGLSLSADGTLSGFPTDPDGITAATLRATDAGSGATLDIPLTMRVEPLLRFVGPPGFKPHFVLTTGVAARIDLSQYWLGGVAPFRIIAITPTAEELSLRGLRLESGNGGKWYLVGTPTSMGVPQEQFDSIIQVRDALGEFIELPYILEILASTGTLGAAKDGDRLPTRSAANINFAGPGVKSVSNTADETTVEIDGVSKAYVDAGDAATLAAALAADLPDAPSDGKTYGRKDGAWAEAGGSSQPLVIALSSVTKSSKFGSSTKLALGSHYFDPTDAQWGLSATSTAKLCMLLETTNAGIAVGGELFQQTGTGSPQIIAAVPTTTSTTAALVTADVSSAFTSTSAAGVFVARCWITTANGSDQCTCSGAWVEVTP